MAIKTNQNIAQKHLKQKKMKEFTNDYQELMFERRHKELNNKINNNQYCKVKDKELQTTTHETKDKRKWLKVVVKVINFFKKLFKVPNSFRIIKISDKSAGSLILNANITTITKNYNGRRVISVHCDVKSECLRGFKG